MFDDFELDELYKEDTVIKVPEKKEISVSVYNDALERLKKSYKESIEVLDSLKQYKIVEDAVDIESLQEAFTEEAIFESWCTGPYFEKVDEANKEEIREIAHKIRKQMTDTPSTVFTKYIRSGVSITKRPTNIFGQLFGTFFFERRALTWFNNANLRLRSWQIVAYLVPGDEPIKKSLKDLNTKFTDLLGSKFELDVIKVNFIMGSFRKKKELTPEEKERGGKFTDLIFLPLILIVKNKGTQATNNSETLSITIENESQLQKLIKTAEMAKNTEEKLVDGKEAAAPAAGDKEKAVKESTELDLSFLDDIDFD